MVTRCHSCGAIETSRTADSPRRGPGARGRGSHSDWVSPNSKPEQGGNYTQVGRDGVGTHQAAAGSSGAGRGGPGATTAAPARAWLAGRGGAGGRDGEGGAGAGWRSGDGGVSGPSHHTTAHLPPPDVFSFRVSHANCRNGLSPRPGVPPPWSPSAPPAICRQMRS